MNKCTAAVECEEQANNNTQGPTERLAIYPPSFMDGTILRGVAFGYSARLRLACADSSAAVCAFCSVEEPVERLTEASFAQNNTCLLHYLWFGRPADEIQKPVLAREQLVDPQNTRRCCGKSLRI